MSHNNHFLKDSTALSAPSILTMVQCASRIPTAASQGCNRPFYSCVLSDLALDCK